MITIYHNPRCSKSREALALLEGRGVNTTIRLYLEDPPDADTLRAAAKVVADAETDEVLGVHMVGPEVTELIAEAALAIELA